jgi:CubicO group peptidase (beta-lactamase class C family)
MLAPTPALPESVGMSKAALERIDAHLRQQYIDAGRFPGAQLMVYRRGKIVHTSSQGFADIERKVPVRDDTIYRIYSMTKPITSVAFMMLVEQGKVALDEPVHKYIPEWKNLGVFVAGNTPAFMTRPPARPMLIVDLLRHTSGLTYGFMQRSNVDAAYREAKLGGIDKDGTLQSMVDDLAKIPLEFSPGEAWNYSVSTDVLGYLVGKISGKPFEQFLKERIFDPLGMSDTDFHVPASKAQRLAACYSIEAGGALNFIASDRKPGLALQDDPATSSFLSPPSFISGGGGLCSTTADYLTFCRALLNGGELDGVRLLGPKTLKLMTSNHLPGGADLPAMSRSMFSEVAYNGVGFGLGVSVTIDPARTLIPGSVGEYAWGGAASTAFFIDPAEELIMIFMTQVMPSSTYPIRRELRTMVYSAVTESNV